jgi:hypothetical protein
MVGTIVNVVFFGVMCEAEEAGRRCHRILDAFRESRALRRWQIDYDA